MKLHRQLNFNSNIVFDVANSEVEICFVVNDVGETSVPADIATALAELSGIKIDILSWFTSHEFDRQNNVSVISLEAPNTVLGVDRRTYRQARDIIRRYDLVQAHHNHSGSFAKLIAYVNHIPVISREGNLRVGFTRKGRVANGLTNALAARTVCNSRPVYDSMMRWERLFLPDRKVEIIPNGVDLERIESARLLSWNPRAACGIDSGAFLVSTAAMFSHQKGLDILIRAVAMAKARTSIPMALLIAGDGDIKPKLVGLAESLGISDAVCFLGLLDRPRVYRLMMESDAYAMPSRWEGFSAAAVEALATETACVFSDIDPFTHPYEDVALFHPVDDADALADRLVFLAEHEAERCEYARRGRELVEDQFTLPPIARQYRDLYLEVLADHEAV